MADTDEARSSRKACMVVAVIVVVLFAAALVFVGNHHSAPPRPVPTPSPTGIESPLIVESSVDLTVPATVRTDSRAFEVAEGRTYLLRFDVSTEKPQGSPGRAMYFGVSLSCAGAYGNETTSVGGTQNLVSGEPVTLTNQFLLTADSTGERSCRVALSSPNAQAAAAGTTVSAEVRWSVEPVDGEAKSANVGDKLPEVVAAGEKYDVIVSTVPVPLSGTAALQILSTLRVTTCTIVNGSREDGKPLCSSSTTDARGSDFDVLLEAKVQASGGEVCGVLGSFTSSSHVDRTTHHEMIHLSKDEPIPDDLCGDLIILTVSIVNDGPAPLLVHGEGTTFLTTLHPG